jgi:PleD family two-component response regulator
MTTPLALIFYESLLTGNQLLNRLQDLGYRVEVASDLLRLPDQAATDKPIIIVTELGAAAERVCAAVRKLRAHPETCHIPVLASFKPANKKADQETVETARDAGVTLVASESGFLGQLPQLLERALDIP